MQHFFTPGLRARTRLFESLVHSYSHLHHHVKINKFHDLNLQTICWVIENKSTKGCNFEFYVHPSWIGNHHYYTDASSLVGFGGWDSVTGNYFQLKWSVLSLDKDLFDIDIDFQELFTVAVAFQLHIDQWKNHAITIHCDNEPVVAMLIKKSCTLKRKDLLALIIFINDICIYNQIDYWMCKVPGSWNPIADGLSRFVRNPFANLHCKKGLSINCQQACHTVIQYCTKLLKNEFVSFIK